ncbi:MAG: xanthine dehydrogenase accessory protein XdhC, partial [Ancylobacter novellus]
MIRVRIVRARGSTPREEGAEMFVGRDAVSGTIGGGHLEYMAIDR